MKYKQIPKSKLIKYRWYLGRGRNNNIGFWDGTDFLTVGYKGFWDIQGEPYYTKKAGCFQPFLLIDEGKIISFGKSGWDSHYGKELIVDKNTQKIKDSSEQFRKKHLLDCCELENTK